MYESWKFPEVSVGDDVLVSSDPTRSDRTYAKVVRVLDDAMTVDAVAWLPRGGTRFFFQCWHINDPRIKEQPDRFHDSASGVFDLTEGEKRRKRISSDWSEWRNEIANKLQAMEERIVTMDNAIDYAVSKQRDDAQDTSVSLPPLTYRRPPGRPRKQETIATAE